MMLFRQRASVEEGRGEGGLLKGTSEEGTGRGMDMDSGREEVSRGGIEHGCKGGKLQRRYPEEGIGQYTVYSQTIRQRVPCH